MIEGTLCTLEDKIPYLLLVHMQRFCLLLMLVLGILLLRKFLACGWVVVCLMCVLVCVYICSLYTSMEN